MDFLSKDDKVLEKEFIEQGYIIREAANKDALDKIQKFVINMLSKCSLYINLMKFLNLHTACSMVISMSISAF